MIINQIIWVTRKPAAQLQLTGVLQQLHLLPVPDVPHLWFHTDLSTTLVHPQTDTDWKLVPSSGSFEWSIW